MLNKLIVIPLCRWYAKRVAGMGDQVAAERLLATAVAKGDKAPETRRALAELLLKRLDFAAALSVLTTGDPVPESDVHHSIQLAWAHQGLGHRDEAKALWSRVVVQKPSGEAWYQLGVLNHQAGQLHEAEDCYRKAMKIDPGHGESRLNLARILMASGQFDAAREMLRVARRLLPDNAAPVCLLGEILAREGNLAEALAEFDRAIAIDNEFPAAHADRGLALHQLGRSAEALPSLHRAIQLAPGNPNAWLTRGSALLQTGRLNEAIQNFREAKERFPGHPAVLSSLGACLGHTRDHQEGAGYLDEALAVDSNNTDAHFNRALQYLREGDYRRGFEHYEARMAKPEMQALAAESPWSPWDGSWLRDKSILIRAEQGFGDALQFARFFTQLAEQGATVHVETAASLTRLLATVPGVKTCKSAVGSDEVFDFWCPLMSLPGRLGVTLESLPRKVPYLLPAEQEANKWKDRMAKLASGRTGLKVGLVWASNPDNWISEVKSLELKQLLPVLQVPDTLFVSLQIGHATEQFGQLPGHIASLDPTPEIKDFHDTACVIQELDLVITIDSAVAHLAGALGKPVWVLLHDTPDWRWGMDSADSPWYPSAKLFRQTEAGDWATPVAAMREALNELAAGGRA